MTNKKPHNEFSELNQSDELSGVLENAIYPVPSSSTILPPPQPTSSNTTSSTNNAINSSDFSFTFKGLEVKNNNMITCKINRKKKLFLNQLSLLDDEINSINQHKEFKRQKFVDDILTAYDNLFVQCDLHLNKLKSYNNKFSSSSSNTGSSSASSNTSSNTSSGTGTSASNASIASAAATALSNFNKQKKQLESNFSESYENYAPNHGTNFK